MTRTIIVKVRNDGTHSEAIGVYVDVVAPGGATNPYGCTPNGRVIQTTVTLSPRQQTAVFSGPLIFDCSDRAGAAGNRYAVIAVADHGANDLPACGASALNSMTCSTALADDDEDDRDQRRSRKIIVVGPQ